MKKQFLILITILFGCQKDAVLLGPLKPDRIDFKGVTQYDIIGGPYLTVDSTDWRLDDNFTSYEASLFNSIDSISSRIDSSYIITSPRPRDTIDRRAFKVVFFRLQPSYIRWVLVDKYYNVIHKDSNVSYRPPLSLLYYTDSFKRGDTFRIYYQNVVSKKVILNGHGDFIMYK